MSLCYPFVLTYIHNVITFSTESLKYVYLVGTMNSGHNSTMGLIIWSPPKEARSKPILYVSPHRYSKSIFSKALRKEWRSSTNGTGKKMKSDFILQGIQKSTQEDWVFKYKTWHYKTARREQQGKASCNHESWQWFHEYDFPKHKPQKQKQARSKWKDIWTGKDMGKR